VLVVGLFICAVPAGTFGWSHMLSV